LKCFWVMPPRFIVSTLVGLIAVLAVVTLVGGRASSRPHPDLALSVPDPALEALAARRRIVIEPLPVAMTTVTLENVNTQERGVFRIGAHGEMDPNEAAGLEHFFRCRRTGRELPMAPGVLAMLADVAHHWPTRTIEVISGFRAAPFGAPHSKHFRGHAIDLRVRGVKTSAVRDYVWRGHHEVGVGHYPETNFVHMDWRPGEPDVAWTGTDEDGTPQYHPRWARRARQVRPGRHGHAPALAVATNGTGTL
jgi:uncharacterized protein YcbK (DUF882 family)